jgi:hypothetical protein
MSTVDAEKIGFKNLIEIKEKLFVELKNYKLEQEAQALHRTEQMENTRKGG